MTKNQFTSLIRKCRSDLFTEIAVEKDGVLIPVTRMCNSKNDGIIVSANQSSRQTKREPDKMIRLKTTTGYYEQL